MVVKKMAKEKEMKISKEGLGIAGFTIGVISIGLAGSLGILFSIVGFIFCMSQQRRNPTKLARIGIILNVIAFVLSILLLFFVVPLLQEQLQNLV